MSKVAEGNPMSEVYEKEVTVTVSDRHVETPDLRRTSSLLSLMGGNKSRVNSRVLGIFLLSALIVTTGRLLAPFEVGTDQSVQLEAAERLTDGMGLTTTNDPNHLSFDISELPAPGYLVQWPPGFSLLVSGFLFAGFSLLASLKIIYAIATLTGWLGWAIIASQLLSEPLRLFGRPLNIHFLIAALLPVFSTPLWKGTDIFLWAAIPFLVLLLFKARRDQSSFVPVMSAGLLFGLTCAIRYASAFLFLAAVLILLQVSYPRIKLFLKRLAVFLLPPLLIVISIAAYMKMSSHGSSGLPAQMTAASGVLAGMFEKVQVILNGSPVTSNLILGFPLLDQLVSAVNSRPLNYVVGSACLMAIVCLPLMVLRSRAPIPQKAQEDLALSLSFLPLSLTVFLIVLRLLSDSSLFKVRRYYEPVALCCIFVFYEIASKRIAHRKVRAASVAIVTIFVAYVILFNSALLVVPARRDQLVQSVLGFTPAKSPRQHTTSQELQFPSWRLYSWKESSRAIVKQLYEANPEALFIAQEYPVYIYDRFQETGPAPGRSVIDFPGVEFLKRAHVSRPIKVFWVIQPATKLDFIPDSFLKLVHFDPIEQTKIYESDFPAGFKLSGGEQ
jgi:hypothetical protein